MALDVQARMRSIWWDKIQFLQGVSHPGLINTTPNLTKMIIVPTSSEKYIDQVEH